MPIDIEEVEDEFGSVPIKTMQEAKKAGNVVKIADMVAIYDGTKMKIVAKGSEFNIPNVPENMVKAMLETMPFRNAEYDKNV